MTVTLYKTESPVNMVTKSLTGDFNISDVKYFASYSQMKPEFRFVFGKNFDYNYLYSKDLKKYYFIDSWDCDGKIYHIHCSEDVLMTFKDQLLECKGIADNRENYSPYYKNVSTGVDVRDNHVTYKFNDMFLENPVILMVGVNNGK